MDEMPAVLQQLLSKQTKKLPDVPTTGALSADQIERQLLLRDAQGDNAMALTRIRSQIME